MKIDKLTFITASIIGLLAEQTVLGSGYNGRMSEDEAMAAAIAVSSEDSAYNRQMTEGDEAMAAAIAASLVSLAAEDSVYNRQMANRQRLGTVTPAWGRHDPNALPRAQARAAAPTDDWRLTIEQIQVDFPGRTITLEDGCFKVKSRVVANGVTSNEYCSISVTTDREAYSVILAALRSPL